MSENENNVPKRRFKEFENAEAWEQRKLGEVSRYFNGGSFENDVKEDGKYELITLKSVDMQGNLKHSGRYIDIEVPTLDKGSLVMILSEQSPGLLGITAKIPVNNRYVLNQRVAEIRPHKGIDSYFLSMAINRNQQYFSKCGAGTKVQNISKPNVENYEFLCPVYKEQQSVGQLFIDMDNLITLHQRKLEKMKALKKAYLTDMFPKEGESKPKLRFAGFTDDWEQRKIGDLFKVTRGNVLSASETVNEKTNEMPYPVYSSQTKNNGLMGYYKDFLFDTAITWTTDGANAGTVNYREGKFYSTNVNGVLLSNEGFANKAIAEALNKVAYKYVSKVGNPKLMNNVMSDIIINIPINIDEQNKISEYFTSLDNVITLHQRKLEKLQNIKKAYLNEMFI
ncbi:restriction endonuclease subunit S [Clostridium botulinum]|nr:restriction endonuclease subunit S [Clostridium botulinum]NFL59898.1 restriction endonuclease subunit S [Clostridium botulinum]NFL63305.1 restriction endonuclease subunit S [Clostridium botulinum]NFO67799.1 restriction endonuclease subunit S [Clostridium botulinum]